MPVRRRERRRRRRRRMVGIAELTVYTPDALKATGANAANGNMR
jgi:hypothetical protein